MIWQYLRETDQKYFDPNRNTSLKTYLKYIFPNDTFIYDKSLPKETVSYRNSSLEYRRYRPDARCENLNIIIEYDGINHYQNQTVILNDYRRDTWFTALGYKVVRIPYWIQLSSNMIKYLFDIDMDKSMCELSFSFYDNGLNDSGLSTSIGSMSEAGRYRFLETVTKYPIQEQRKVYRDLKTCIENLDKNIPEDYILPKYILDSWLKKTPNLI